MVYALIGDVHGNLRALEAVLEDINKRGIKNIISVGDVVGLGPHPSECLDLIIKNNIRMIAGNAEEYIKFGADAFFYLKNPQARYDNAVWTKSQLRKDQLEFINSLPHSIEINEFGHNIGICHFPIDVRYDYDGVWKYEGKHPRVFNKTNTRKDKRFKIDNALSRNANEDPLFGGKKLSSFDVLIYGHYHFYREHKLFRRKLISLNGTGVGIHKCATYQLMIIKKNYFYTNTRYIPYDYESEIEEAKRINQPNLETYIKYITCE